MEAIRRYSCKYCVETSDLVHTAPKTGKQQLNVGKVIGTRILYSLRYHSSGLMFVIQESPDRFGRKLAQNAKSVPKERHEILSLYCIASRCSGILHKLLRYRHWSTNYPTLSSASSAPCDCHGWDFNRTRYFDCLPRFILRLSPLLPHRSNYRSVHIYISRHSSCHPIISSITQSLPQIFHPYTTPNCPRHASAVHLLFPAMSGSLRVWRKLQLR